MSLNFSRFIIILLFILIGISPAGSSIVQSADSAYMKGEYAEAVTLYQQIIDTKGASSQLYYNLGNSYVKSGDYGNAMLAYLRSLRLDPSNKSSKQNLKFIESKVYETNQSELRGKKYSLDPDEDTFFTNVKLMIARDHLSNSWAIWAIVCFLLFIGCVSIYIFTRNVTARKIGFFGGFILFAISIIFIVFSLMAASYTSEEGVIITPKVKLMTEANIGSKQHPVNLTRGTRLKILEVKKDDADQKNWYKVRLNSDYVGWIQDTDFVPVDTYWGDGI